jgi:hypothetical protein
MQKSKLKTDEDRKALWDLLDWIDVIISNHSPHTIKEKQQNSIPGFPECSFAAATQTLGRTIVYMDHQVIYLNFCFIVIL